MKILYDHQIFSLQKYGGISRYFIELRRALQALGNVETGISMAYSNNQYIRDFQTTVRPFQFARGWWAQKHLIYLANLPRSITEIRRGAYDVFHPTYYGTYFLHHLKERPFVLTVHDMIHERFPNEYAGRADIIARKKKMIKTASRIIAISENTKLDIIHYYDIESSKIQVVHLGNSFPTVTATEPRPSDFPARYLLFVGLRSGYKNFSLFAEAIADLFAEDRDLRLICVGGGPFNSDEKKHLSRLLLVDKVIQVSPTDEELARLYRHASLFAFPSLYEGFGIPILEAFGAGCPVVVSDTGSFPEVAGEAAAYFNPRDPGSIRAVIGQILGDPNRASALREAGRRRLARFDWLETARKTKEVYREACEVESKKVHLRR